MKIKFLFFISVVIMITSIIITSCGKNEVSTDVIDKVKYDEFACLLTNDLTLLGNEIRNNSLTFGDTEAVEKSAQEIYRKQPEVLNAFLNNYKTEKLKSANVVLNDYHPEISKAIGDIETALFNSAGSEDFLRYLDTKFKSVYSSTISTENKEKLLKYIVSYEVAIQFIQINNDILRTNINNPYLKSTQGWWADWGKCAAGILGGAGTGALTFGLGGAAVGTITLPIVGTVSAGLVGAVGGAIAGCLTGAAASCD